jgi:ornithine cyclodeaminase/alanine dehydrogenase-like protein (mu-crystallin family)
MTLIINNDDVAKVLTIDTTMDALEASYHNLSIGEATCRPRIDIRIPTSDPKKNYQFGSMEGGSTGGYFAVRMKSDIVYESSENGVFTQEKYCTEPGKYCGFIFLTSVETGEPLALIHDGLLQHMRVAGDGGIGVKYMARTGAEVVGMLGSGGMARSHMDAFLRVRPIKKLQVYSPTKAHREAFGREMAAKHGIEVKVCERPEDIYRGADILAALTDSVVPVLDAPLIEPGSHIVFIGGSLKPDAATMQRVDVYLRFGDAPAPVHHPELALADEYIAWEARPDSPKFGGEGRNSRAVLGVALPEKRVTLADVVSGKAKGRTSDDQITWSERGNLQGAQFYAVAGAVYELARKANLGYELPTRLLLQDIRD